MLILLGDGQEVFTQNFAGGQKDQFFVRTSFPCVVERVKDSAPLVFPRKLNTKKLLASKVLEYLVFQVVSPEVLLVFIFKYGVNSSP